MEATTPALAHSAQRHHASPDRSTTGSGRPGAQALLRPLAESFARCLGADAAVAATLDGDGSSVVGAEWFGSGNGATPGALPVPAELIAEAIATGRALHGRISDGGRDTAGRFAIVVPVRVGRLTAGVLWAGFSDPPPALDRALEWAGEFGAVMAACMRGVAADALSEATGHDRAGCLSGPGILRALSREVARCERHRRPLSICVIGINGPVDSGRRARGRALAEVGRGLRAGLRPYDVVGRLGGDEFLVVLPETRRPGAVAAVRHLCQAVGEMRRNGGAQPDVSVGIAEWDGGKRAVDLLADADRELRAR